MNLIPQHVIESVSQAVDLVDLIGRYVPLKRAGRSYAACCPFHQEKTPSFHVWRETGTWKCFGCGKRGHAFGFLMEKEGLSFPEAVRQLAAEHGIDVEPEDPAQARAASRRAGLMEVAEWAARHFEGMLRTPEGKVARDYLKGRGITGETALKFRLGFAPPGWSRLLDAARGAGMGADVMVEAGLAIRRDGEPGRDASVYDRFRNRVVFPICDAQGRVISFGARALGDEEPKYLNGSDTPIFHKGRHLYGLHHAKKAMLETGEGAVMEGYTDVIMAHQAGWPVAVAGLGTALTRDQARAVARYVRKLWLIYDGDAAGMRAAERAVPEFLGADLEARVAVLPEGADPFDVLRDEGLEAFRERLTGAREAFDHLVHTRKEAAHAAGIEDDAWVLDGLLEVLAGIDETARRDSYLGRLAGQFSAGYVSVRGLYDRVQAIRTRNSGRAHRREDPDPETTPSDGVPALEPLRPLPAEERLLLEAVVGDPEVLSSFGAPRLLAVLGHPGARRMVELLAASPSGARAGVATLADPRLAALGADLLASGQGKALLPQARDCLSRLEHRRSREAAERRRMGASDRDTENEALRELQRILAANKASPPG